MCFPTDLDKLDNEKKELIQSDISALHHFYSKHLEFPDNESLVALFAQVRGTASGDMAVMVFKPNCTAICLSSEMSLEMKSELGC